MRIVNVAKIVVENPAGEVLLLRRSKTDPRRPGQWDFPGGGIEAGESFQEAVIRETEEEAGLTIAEPTLVYTATEVYEPKQESVNRALFHIRVGEAATGRVRTSFEHDEYKWVSKAQALVEFPHPFYSVGLRYALDNGLL